MVPFPCSPDMTRLYDHTIYEHTLRSTRCSITIYRSLQQEEWNTNQIARNLWKNSLSVNSASSPVRSERTMRRIRRAHHVSILGLLQREVPACKGGGIYENWLPLFLTLCERREWTKFRTNGRIHCLTCKRCTPPPDGKSYHSRAEEEQR